MKLQLNESTLNAYINEAIRQELNEGLFSKGTTAVRAIGHSPITKKFFGRIKDAKSARKFIMGLRRGKVVSGTVESGKGAKGLNWFTKDGKTFFRDAACKQQITNPAELRAVSGSFKGHYTAAANLFNSAQRNMLGTAAVAGLGAGLAMNNGGQKNGNNNGNPGTGEDSQNSGGNGGGFDGIFPWDDTTPSFAPPRQPRNKQPNDNQEGNQQEEPVKRVVGPELPKLEPGSLQAGATTNQNNALNAPQSQPTLAQSAVHSMVQTANAPASDMSLRDKRQTVNRTAANARDAINQGYGNRQDKQMVRDVRRQINRG